MTPCFFLQSYESPQIEQSLAALKTVGLSVQTYSFSANVTGGHGVRPEPADSAERRPALARQADSRRRCWLVTKLCSFRTAVCSGYLEQLCTALVSRKALSLGLLSFLQIKSYYTHSKHMRREFFALPFAHTCATLPCAAFCACVSGSLSTEGEGGQKSAHSAGSNSGKTIP